VILLALRANNCVRKWVVQWCLARRECRALFTVLSVTTNTIHPDLALGLHHEVEAPRIFRKSHSQVARFTALNPQEIFLVLISVRSWVDTKAIVRPEGVSQWRITMAPSEVKQLTFRLLRSAWTNYTTTTPKMKVHGGIQACHKLRNLQLCDLMQPGAPSCTTLLCVSCQWRSVLPFSGWSASTGQVQLHSPEPGGDSYR
jgi:hypothetical protein